MIFFLPISFHPNLCQLSTCPPKDFLQMWLNTDCLAWLCARGFLQSKGRLLYRGSPYTAAPLLYDFLLSTAHLLQGLKVINWHKLHKAEGLVPLSNVSVRHFRRPWLNAGLISMHKFWISAWRTPAQEGNLKPPLYQATQIHGLSNWRDYRCSLCFCCNCLQKPDRSRMGTRQHSTVRQRQQEFIHHTTLAQAKHLCFKNKKKDKMWIQTGQKITASSVCAFSKSLFLITQLMAFHLKNALILQKVLLVQGFYFS